MSTITDSKDVVFTAAVFVRSGKPAALGMPRPLARASQAAV